MIQVSQWMGQLLDGASEFPHSRRKKSQANESTVQRARGENGTDCQPLRSAPSLPAPPVSSTRPTHLPRARRKWREHAIPSTLTTIGVDPLEALPGQGADRARTERHHPPLPSPQLIRPSGTACRIPIRSAEALAGEASGKEGDPFPQTKPNGRSTAERTCERLSITPDHQGVVSRG